MRRLVNRVMGRKKTIDEFLSIGEVLNLLYSLDSSVEIDLSYHGRLSRRIEWINESPVRVSTFLGFQFAENSDEISFNRHQVFKGKLAEKHYFDLKDLHQKASLNYLV